MNYIHLNIFRLLSPALSRSAPRIVKKMTVFISSSTFRPQAFFKKMNLKIIVTFCHLFSLSNVSHVNAVFAVHCDVIHVVFLARCARTLLCCVPCTLLLTQHSGQQKQRLHEKHWKVKTSDKMWRLFLSSFSWKRPAAETSKS